VSRLIIVELRQQPYIADIAKRCGNEAVKVLLDAKTAITIKDKIGKTALFYTVKNNHKEIINLFKNRPK
jgi:ankyrin repeat protein